MNILELKNYLGACRVNSRLENEAGNIYKILTGLIELTTANEKRISQLENENRSLNERVDFERTRNNRASL